jgi:hypothetical protein
LGQRPVIPLGAWDFEVEEEDLNIMEPKIQRDPVLRDYFTGRTRYMFPPGKVEDLYRSLGRVKRTKRSIRAISMGIKDIIKLNKITQKNSGFKVNYRIKALMKEGFDFYKIKLVADFRTDKKWKFTYATIRIELDSKIIKDEYPKIYSIVPEKIMRI